jgi:membrane-associated HD superfamily phosphohydrolase
MKNDENRIIEICKDVTKKHITLNSAIIKELIKQGVEVDEEETESCQRNSETGVAAVIIGNEEYVVRRDTDGEYIVIESTSELNIQILCDEAYSEDNVADDAFLRSIGEL